MGRLIGALSAAVLVAVLVWPVSVGAAWFVVKDKNGVCKVIEAEKATPKTVAGPFSTKAEADQGKPADCKKSKR